MSSPRRWLLPEAIEDILPEEARHVELLRRGLLDVFSAHGYELVVPPLLEYVDSLLTGSGRDLDLRTFKLIDQLSGRTMGIRADITPQVARIDAHLLNRRGVARLAYCGSVLHALPAGLLVSREPLQIGAEIYGHAGVEADVEIVRLLGECFDVCGLSEVRIDLGHIGIFRALVEQAGCNAQIQQELFSALQAKDASTLQELVAPLPLSLRDAFMALPECYGSASSLADVARRLPRLPQIVDGLATLERLCDELSDLSPTFDLADLRGYHYHSGIVFAAYFGGHPGALALGGRYDQVGLSFGRGRPATGFSLDLREIARLAPQPVVPDAILAPCSGDEDLRVQIAALRQSGERVVVELPGHEGTWREAGCDRRLVRVGPAWSIETLKED
jgi:ATP phosphoribosyltransferase regulatory subunit